jgi:hypothetical protein
MRIVNGDPAGADVRLRADLGVADVGQVRHLCPFSDPRVLQFDERARLCSGFQHGSGAKVTERANQRSLSDLGVDRDHVRPDLGADKHARRPTQDGEGVDDCVRLELDLRVDPGRQRIDDRRAGEHVPLVDAISKDRGCRGKLDPGVDPDRRLRVV